VSEKPQVSAPAVADAPGASSPAAKLSSDQESRALVLKKGEERRLQAGHLWVYSNEVDTAKSPFAGFSPGEQVPVYSSRGKPVGMVCVNPRSLICARLYSYRTGEMLGTPLLRRRLASALELRQRMFSIPCYRLVHGEGDWLPGLVVDRYGDYLIVQTNTWGMDQLKDEIVEVLVELLQPKGVFLRNTSSTRSQEGLEPAEALLWGEVPDTTEIIENGLRYEIPLKTGQKTGWFYDHRDNRQQLQQFSAGKRVLDAYCYLGGWGINALAGGASEVVAIDSSAPALDGARQNAALNGFADRWSGIKGDVSDQLRLLRDAGEKFDVVVLDPPAFIQRAKDKRKGVEKYRSINSLAAAILQPDGMLVSGSCSHHLTDSELQRAVLQGGRKNGFTVQVVARGHQGRDHPVHAAIPETEYLKAVFARLLR